MADVVVIGGGAAGCVAAIKAAEAGADVVLMEKNAKLGRKIMITGKGRCNITNAKKWSDFSPHLHNKPSFFKPAFYNFSNEDTVAFFESIGVETTLTRDDRVFPKTMMASTVVDALAARIDDLNIDTMFGCDVTGVGKEADGSFKITYVASSGNRFSSGSIVSPAVIVATGGLSYPATGSTGAGYDIARSFGHTIQRTFPSLTALVPASYDTRLRDITLLNVTASLIIGRDVAACEFGEVQFTDGGIEGPVGFKISRKAVWALVNGDKVTVSLDLKPAVSLEALKRRVEYEASEAGVSRANFPKRAHYLLRKFMPASLMEPFLSSGSVTLDNLAASMKDWKFKIQDYVGYRRAVITAGGVSLDEIVSRTMSSRNAQGLYFAGEVLDIDGDTGGYNLQFAFSTGALAGKSAAEYSEKIRKSL